MTKNTLLQTGNKYRLTTTNAHTQTDSTVTKTASTLLSYRLRTFGGRLDDPFDDVANERDTRSRLSNRHTCRRTNFYYFCMANSRERRSASPLREADRCWGITADWIDSLRSDSRSARWIPTSRVASTGREATGVVANDIVQRKIRTPGATMLTERLVTNGNERHAHTEIQERLFSINVYFENRGGMRKGKTLTVEGGPYPPWEGWEEENYFAEGEGLGEAGGTPFRRHATFQLSDRKGASKEK